MSNGLPRCACGFVMPGPMHGLDCKLYDPGRIYGTTIPPHKVALLHCDGCLPWPGNERIYHEERALERKVDKATLRPEKVSTGTGGHFIVDDTGEGE